MRAKDTVDGSTAAAGALNVRAFSVRVAAAGDYGLGSWMCTARNDHVFRGIGGAAESANLVTDGLECFGSCGDWFDVPDFADSSVA